MAKKKEAISLFSVVAENLSSNELGLKTKKLNSQEDQPETKNHNCKKELSEILYDYKVLFIDLNNFKDEFQRKLSNIERRLYKLMEDH